ncbi:uncharacterized protein [Coffea arabica]|uniref:Uncharacterized protein n=1 Tax=Coffea arabica TaxID=13443 RepID=A0A6P6WLB6_COFAR|nr:protein ENHANCED DISEASE RESISTANCE 4-like [Coffea arabica]
MSEPAEVRLVQCPKCENLLPELTHYSVYQCGACSAVLRAKSTNGDVDALSEKSEEERNEGFSGRLAEKSKDIEVPKMSKINAGEVSEDDVKSNDNSSNRSDRRRFFHDRTENYGASQVTGADKWVVEDGLEVDDNIIGINGTKRDKNFKNMKPQIGGRKGFLISSEQLDWRNRGRESEMEDFRRDQRIDPDGTRYLASKYSEEGPSNYQLQSNYGYRKPVINRNELGGSDDVEHLVENQAELLRKLDELKDKLSRSCNVVDEPKDKVPPGRRMVHPDPYGYSEKWFSENYLASNRPPAPYSFPYHDAARPSYANHSSETSPFINRHAMVGPGFYPPMHTSAHLQEFEDPLRSQMFRRGPQAPVPFQQKPPPAHFSRMYADSNIAPMDSFESFPPNMHNHHPSCSCFHCHSTYQVPRQVPYKAYGVKQFSDVTDDPAFYHHEYQNASGAKHYGGRFNASASFKSSSSVSRTRWPSDLQSEASGLVRSRPSKVLLSTSRHRCLPVAGGAPFFACQNCLELLLLPDKVQVDKNLMKIRCGACSTLILLTVDSKRLSVSVHAELNPTHKKFNVRHSDNLKEGSSQTRGHPKQASINFSSDDYDNSGCNFQSMDREFGPLSTGPGSSIKSADIRSPHSTFSSSSEKEENLENLTAIRKSLNSSELPVKGKLSPPPAGSPLQDYFDYSNKYNAANRLGNATRSGHFEEEKSISKKTITRQNSMKDASATEIEISSNEYSNTGTSLDSGEASREGDQMRANKAAESFFAGMIKKSFRDSNISYDDADTEKANVTVNGYLISERLIKKAEKQAGPIQPGYYWYDFRAGFWGVIGGPCLGIIPPFIEEFNHPMPETCTGGSTGVFVNGRELHQKDLNLLGSRGLPTDRGRSFIVEISGRVLDEDTGEELKSLGKLAPTIERLKRGFGMKDPKAVV